MKHSSAYVTTSSVNGTYPHEFVPDPSAYEAYSYESAAQAYESFAHPDDNGTLADGFVTLADGFLTLTYDSET